MKIIKFFWDNIQQISSLAALIVIIVGLVSYFNSLDTRIKNLESKWQAIATSPTASTEKGAMIDACVNLANRAADEQAKGKWASMDSFNTLMNNLGCARIGN